MEILINSLRVRAFHGVMAQEHTVGQEFEISLRLNVYYDGLDSLDSTINYAEVCDLLADEMRTPDALLEHCARRLVDALCRRYPQLRGGRLTLLKLAPPIAHELASAGVALNF